MVARDDRRRSREFEVKMIGREFRAAQRGVDGVER